MPAKLWADFERLTASDLNTYLAQQVASIFASAAARDAAIPAPVTGQPAYLLDAKALTVYDGTIWRELVRQQLGAQIAATATQSIPNASDTALVMPAVPFDMGGFALGSNALTVPAGADGLYDLQAFVYLSSTAGYGFVRVKVGGAAVANELEYGTGIKGLTARRVMPLVAGQIVTATVEHNHGSALPTIHEAAQPASLTAVRIGPSS